MSEERTVIFNLDEIREIANALNQAYKIIFDQDYQEKRDMEDDFIDVLVLLDMIMEQGR